MTLVAVCTTVEILRMHACPLPQISAPARMSHAISGGLEKYPHSKSSDQDQYWDSS